MGGGEERAPTRRDGTALHPESAPPPLAFKRIRLEVVEGPAAGQVSELDGTGGSIGSHPLNALRLDDPTVSRFHCQITCGAEGPVVADLGSTNRTYVDGVAVREAFLRHGSILRMGQAVVRVDLTTDEVPLPQLERFGSLVGVSGAMRATLALLAKASASETSVLLEGETGTGKGQAAEALHLAGPRRDQPLIVVDCGGIPENLLESELFGHEKGAFTGADDRRIGAFEEASGGTLFLDEVGELPIGLQPKLLRALENREIRRLGQNRFIPVDLRVIAATNRDLRGDVNAGRFRADLYYRLAVVKIRIPPVRERPEDLPALVTALLGQLGAPPEAADRLMTPAWLDAAQRSPWAGNVRELRNHVERSLLFGHMPVARGSAPVAARPVMPFAEARRIARDAFEKDYLESLLHQFEGKVGPAAEAARMDRVYFYRLLRRQGLRPGP